MNTSKVKIAQTVPLFAVADMKKSVAFYVDGLGFELQEKWEKDDELQWCWVQHDDSALMLQKSQGEAREGGGLTLYFICEDARIQRTRGSSRRTLRGLDVFYAGISFVKMHLKAAHLPRHRSKNAVGIQVGEPFVGQQHGRRIFKVFQRSRWLPLVI